MHNSKCILATQLYMFRAISLPIIRSYLLYNRHWYILCRCDDLLLAGRLPETCRVVLPKYIWNCASFGFIQKEFITMHGHTNIKVQNTFRSSEVLT
jgi:hypothetical protein